MLGDKQKVFDAPELGIIHTFSKQLPDTICGSVQSPTKIDSRNDITW